MGKISLAEMIETIVMCLLGGRDGAGAFGTVDTSVPNVRTVILFDGRKADVFCTAYGWEVEWNGARWGHRTLIDAAALALGADNVAFPLEQFRKVPPC